MKHKRNVEILWFFIKDKSKKNWLQIIKELTSQFISQRKIPVNYITNLLYRKEVTNIEDYLNLNENDTLFSWSYSHAKDEIGLVENKLLFNDLMLKNNISTPKIIFYNSKNSFYYNHEILNIDSKKSFLFFLGNVFKNEETDRIFCKPIDGSMGKNIFILEKNKYKNLNENVINTIISESFIFQEVVLQHEILKKINDSSLNTLRVVTYKNKENIVEVLSGFIRLGRKGAIVDNAHAGGIVVSFNKYSGKMRPMGLQLIDNGGGIFYHHPDSSIVFEDYQIPYYSEVIDVVSKASRFLKFPLLGWDVAITPNGPTIVEVNHNFHLFLSDRMENGFKRIPSVKKILEQIHQKNI